MFSLNILKAKTQNKVKPIRTFPCLAKNQFCNFSFQYYRDFVVGLLEEDSRLLSTLSFIAPCPNSNRWNVRLALPTVQTAFPITSGWHCSVSKKHPLECKAGIAHSSNSIPWNVRLALTTVQTASPGTSGWH